MVVTDYNEQFLDKRGVDHLIEELKAYIDSIATGNIDLSDYVTKSELQAKLDALDINIDLSSYATKEELTNAINSIDLSAYAKKTEIPSLDGYATTEYVDNAIANVPSGDGNVDLSNYYTKEETYSKTEVNTLVANSGDSNAPMLSMEDWIELNTQYDENVNFQNKKVYFDTSIAFRKLLNDKTYKFYLYDGDGISMNTHNYVRYENGKLTICHYNRTPLEGKTVSLSPNSATIYDKTQSDGEFDTPPGRWVNGWRTTTDERFNKVLLFEGALQLNNWISTPNFGFEEADMGSYDIDGKELYIALMKCIIKIEDEDGNEIAFKTVPTQEDYLEYVNNLSGGTVDLSNYYTKDEVYSKSETDALIPTVTDGVDGITPHIDETTKHWMIGDTDTGVMAEGVNGSDGVSPTVTVTKEGKVATITCTDVNGTTTATISDGADGQGGSGGSSSGGTSTNTSNVYSTEEVVVGTWIDGKPIYRKVVNYTEAISHNTYTTFLSDIENIESIIYLGGMVDDRNIIHYPVPFYLASNTYCWVAYNLNNNYFAVQLNIGNAGVSGIRIVIEYTKTSDK